MIPAVIVLLQLFIPLVLIWRLWTTPRRSMLGWTLFITGLVSYVAAIAVAGVWLALPWYTGLVYLLLVACGVLLRADDVRALRWRPRGRFGWVEVVVGTLLVAGAGGLLVQSIASRRAPADASINLAFPLHGGTYYLVNGGGGELTNAHVETLADRARAFRGQSYAVDIVRIDERGLRASGLQPSDNSRYMSTGEPVLSPCDGRVLQAENTVADTTPPTVDPAQPTGNYVLLDCGAAQVFLGHLRQGSVAVERGQWLRAGERLGVIGNSGNSDEPHLHIHAQRAAAADSTSMLDARPVPMTFYGRALARNDLVRTAAVPPPAMTETQLLYGQLGSTMVALLMLVVSVRRRTAGLALFSLLFAWAAVANARTAWYSPEDYLGYAAFALVDLYRWFILGFFGQHVATIVLTIATGQALIAALLLGGRRSRRIGLAGAILFLLAIAPLGIGAGAPATVIMALGAAALWRQSSRPRLSVRPVEPATQRLAA